MSKILTVASTIGALVMAATPLLAIGSFAHAAEPNVRPIDISLSGLDLSQPKDAGVFNRRVDAAATAFCGRGAFDGLSRLSACRQAVRDEAVEKLSSVQQRELRLAAASSLIVRLASR